MFLIGGATGERDECERGKAGEDQIFNHISVLGLVLPARKQ
jgi:hypothetical protein